MYSSSTLASCNDDSKLFEGIQEKFEQLLAKEIRITKDVLKVNHPVLADAIQRLNAMYKWILSLHKTSRRQINTKSRYVRYRGGYNSRCVRALVKVLPRSCRAYIDEAESLRNVVVAIRKYYRDHDSDEEGERGILSGANVTPLSCVGLTGVLGRSPQGVATSEIHRQQKRSFVETTYTRNPESTSDSEESNNDVEARSSSSIHSSHSSSP